MNIIHLVIIVIHVLSVYSYCVYYIVVIFFVTGIIVIIIVSIIVIIIVIISVIVAFIIIVIMFFIIIIIIIIVLLRYYCDVIIVIVTIITVHLACFILFNRLIQAMANINKMCCDGAAQVPPSTTASDMGHREIPELNGGLNVKIIGKIGRCVHCYVWLPDNTSLILRSRVPKCEATSQHWAKLPQGVGKWLHFFNPRIKCFQTGHGSMPLHHGFL